VVPLTVFFGDEAFLDQVDLSPWDFYQKLAAAPALPTTSQPAPGIWAELYERLLGRYSRIYSVHLSRHFSGTFETACGVAAAMRGVKVIDSQLATGGFALLVQRMIERIDRGTSEEEFDDYIEYYHRRKSFLFLPTTLDYLYKGGRIGRASHLVGTLLNIKPVLEIKDGVADAYKKARGMRQALVFMRNGLVERTDPGSEIHACLSHGFNVPVMEQLQELIEQIDDRTIHLHDASIVGCVIGTYIGPGAVGLGFIQE
jgi:DegV family protein with EDD domain